MGEWRYAVVLDAGSSGTRAHVYRWPDPATKRPSAKIDELTSLPEIKSKSSWAKKIKPGVSSFAESPAQVGPDHLQPLLDHVLDVIPSKAVEDTPIFLLATAGMRLLSAGQQTDLLDNVCAYVRETTDFLLPDCDVHVKVIDGKTEGLYGWIATNYLLNGFDEPEAHDHGKDHHTYGFLDMGGASAQLAFAPNATESEKHADDLTLLRLRTLNGKSSEFGVFVTSWLGFGVREARNRYVKSLLKVAPGSPDKKKRLDPCLPAGMRTTSDGAIIPSDSPVPNDTSYLVGTGKFDECLQTTIPLLAKDVPCEDDPCLLNGVHVPAIDFDVNHFVGISEYWHTTHEIFEAAHSDKAYDFDTYQHRVKEFCSQDWSSLAEGISQQKWGKKVDEQTAYEVCFKAAWIINVLHDGIGIPRVGIEHPPDSGHNPINNGTKQVLDHGKNKGYLDPFQAVNTIDSTEVSWTLGKAVLYAASQVPPDEDSLPVGFGSNSPGGVPDDFQYPASPRLPIPIPPHIPESNSTADHWHDTLFDGDSPRRIPGIFLFLIIILIALFFLCGRDRRARAFRKCGFGFGRGGGGAMRRKAPMFGGKIPFLGRRNGGVSYERVLEEGAHRDFELDSSIDSDGESNASISPTSSIPLGQARNLPRHPMLKYDLDNSSSHSLHSLIGHNEMDRNGLAVRTESRERLSPFSLGPTHNGRRSRATSPVRLKTPFIPD